MHLVVDQQIRAGVRDVQEAFVDPTFYASLGQLQGISPPAVVSFSSDTRQAHMELRYRFSGDLNSAARRILDPARLTWLQVSDVDLARKRTEVRMVAEHYANLISFSGWYELRDASPGQSLQHFEADLSVHVPLLGPLAEHGIAGGIRHNVAETARLVESYVHGRSH